MTIPSYTYDLPARTQLEETFNVNAENWVSWFTSEAAPAINDAIGVINGLLPGIIVYEPVGAWGALTTYTYLDVVVGSDGYTYRSIAAGENFGNDPVTDGGTHWVLVGQPVMASLADILAGTSSAKSISPSGLASYNALFHNRIYVVTSGVFEPEQGIEWYFVEIIGGGGGGGRTTSAPCGGGGGQGAKVSAWIKIPQGYRLVYSVGAGGAKANTGSVIATEGGDTTVSLQNAAGTTTYLYISADGGRGGVGDGSGPGGFDPIAATIVNNGYVGFIRGLVGEPGYVGQNGTTSRQGAGGGGHSANGPGAGVYHGTGAGGIGSLSTGSYNTDGANGSVKISY